MLNSANLLTAFVVLFAGCGLAIGILLIGQLSRAYDEIGAGIFDRARGANGDRPPPDAEYDEWLDALVRSKRPPAA